MTINRLNRGLPDLPRSQLRAEWRFTDYGDTTMRDYSGSARDMLLVGPTWSTAGLTFNGNVYLGVVGTGVAVFSGTSFSIIAAIRATIPGTARTIIGPSGSAAGTNGIQFGINSSEKLFINKASAVAIGTSNTSLSNQWRVVAGTYDGTTARFYYDGMPDGAATSVQTMSVLNSFIGKRGNTIQEGFNGEMAYLVAYDRALTQPEVAYASTNIARHIGLLPAKRRIWYASAAVASTIIFRKTRSLLGTRTGTRQGN